MRSVDDQSLVLAREQCLEMSSFVQKDWCLIHRPLRCVEVVNHRRSGDVSQNHLLKGAGLVVGFHIRYPSLYLPKYE